MTYTYEYPRMMVTVDAVIFLVENNEKKPKVLLIKRKNNPYQNSYALPGGFPEMDELLVDAAKRELFEETGLTNIHLKQFYTFDAVERDPRGRNISVAFLGLTSPDNCQLKAGDDASEADWFPVNQPPSLAFDHKEVIDIALRQLEKK